MMCCDDIENLGCFKSCDPFINTKLTADISGVWNIEIQFSSIIKCFKIEVDQGSTIKIPNVFNENMVHIIRIYRPTIPVNDDALSNELSHPFGHDDDRTLFNNTCYKLKTIQGICY